MPELLVPSFVCKMASAAAKKSRAAARGEIQAVTCQIKYHGFVYVDGGENDGDAAFTPIPQQDKIKEAYTLLKKPKKARKAHPLFARGFDTKLSLRCAEQGLKISVKDDSGSNQVVMDHPIHKIAFVMNQGKSVLFIAKRRMDSTHDQFKCHGFETDSSKTAVSLATHIIATCNSVFRKLRKTRKQIRKKTEKEGKAAPAVKAQGPASTEEAERLRLELQAEVDAAKSYRQSLQLALADLDDEEDDEEEEDAQMKDMDEGLQIQYEEFADEFAKISLEIAKAAELQAAEGRRTVLVMDGEGDMNDEVEDDEEYMPSGVNFDDEEYMVARAASI